MKGLAQAEWLRFRKRRVLLLIVIAVPLLAGFLFFGSYASSVYVPPPFDPEEVRARSIARGTSATRIRPAPKRTPKGVGRW